MQLDKIRYALADRRLNVVSQRTGINKRTLENLHFGRTEKPHVATLKLLADYLGVSE